MTLADELRNCLGELLGSGIPEASSDSEPFRFFRQWLAERNLGLVPIADPASFDWAGKWIGGDRRFRCPTCRSDVRIAFGCLA